MAKKKKEGTEDQGNLKLLLMVAKDMQKVMGIEDDDHNLIFTKETLAEMDNEALFEAIRKYAAEVEPGDEFKEETRKFLAELADPQEPVVKEEEKEEEEEEKKGAQEKVTAKKKEKKTEKKMAEKEERVTKKAVVISMVSRKKGASLSEMAEQMVKLGIDSDKKQNARTAKLWIPKIGFKVSLVKDKYVKA